MAPGGGGQGTQGRGEYLKYSFNAADWSVTNSAIAGRSARSFTREGRFKAVASSVNPGDWVVIEFRHNDGGSLKPTDNGRSDCPGDGSQTCTTTFDGVPEVVQTYPTYQKDASKLMLDAGARVIISSATPDNRWESGTFKRAADPFNTYAEFAATQLGGSAAEVFFVNHGAYSAQAMDKLGSAVVEANYPNDHTIHLPTCPAP